MRAITALSPTSLMLFWRDPIAWYIRYCAEPRLPRQLQSLPASVGSAFDAFIKSLLYARFYPGKVTSQDHPYAASALLKAQVEEQNREWASRAGVHCLDQYNRSGALADLFLETATLSKMPQFEFRVRETLTLEGFEVPVYGIPDMSYHNENTSPLTILDWKVNGFCSKSVTSPAPGYIKCRDGWDYSSAKPSRTANKAHPNACPTNKFGILVSSVPLEESNEDWAIQTTTYAWLLGVLPCKGDFICAIEQLCGNPRGTEFPDLRIASFRSTVSRGFQETLVGKYTSCWHAYKSGHIFLTETRAASDDQCKFLDNICNTLMTADPADRQWEAAIEFISGRNFYDLYHDYRTEILTARGIAHPNALVRSSSELVTKGSGLINLAGQA